ncbi:MAG TPA: EF-hand domain-containing protein [Burkholderiales bacterium]|nr:EF-hand domain-containing protein [Burkholderiales bacterium]
MRYRIIVALTTVALAGVGCADMDKGQKGTSYGSNASESAATSSRNASAPVRSNRSAATFDALDTNGNGFITPDEINAKPGLSVQEFGVLDKDGDGRLTQAEYSSQRTVDRGSAGTGSPTDADGSTESGNSATSGPGTSGAGGRSP